MSDLVLTILRGNKTAGYDLYARAKNLLKGNVPYTFICRGVESKLVGVLSLFSNPDDYATVAFPGEPTMLKNTGWTRENYFVAPAILVIGLAE